MSISRLLVSELIFQAASPLAPSALEWVVILFGVLHIAMFLILLFWLPRQKTVSPYARLAGITVAFFLPVIGPLIVWRSARRNTERTHSV